MIKSSHQRTHFRPTDRETKRFLYLANSHRSESFLVSTPPSLFSPEYREWIRTRDPNFKTQEHAEHQQNTEGKRRNACNDLILQLNQTLI